MKEVALGRKNATSVDFFLPLKILLPLPWRRLLFVFTRSKLALLVRIFLAGAFFAGAFASAALVVVFFVVVALVVAAGFLVAAALEVPAFAAVLEVGLAAGFAFCIEV